MSSLKIKILSSEQFKYVMGIVNSQTVTRMVSSSDPNVLMVAVSEESSLFFRQTAVKATLLREAR